jgi:hypothetical protein
MMNLSISLLVFALIFGGALAGMAVRPLLSEHHLHSDSKDVVKLTAGLIGTLSALVLGLLIASAKATFDQKTNPGQADDRNDHSSGRSAYAIRTGSNLCPKAPAAEHTTDG